MQIRLENRILTLELEINGIKGNLNRHWLGSFHMRIQGRDRDDQNNEN